MKVIFALAVFFIIKYIFLNSKEEKAENVIEFSKNDSGNISESQKKRGNLNKTQIDYYSSRTSVDLSKLIACAKKLGFKLEELTSEEVLYLTMRLDIVGSVPAFFRMKNNGANVILSLKDGCFAFIGNFYMPEHYSKKEIELFTHILNRNQIDSFPMLCVCNSVYNGLEILFFTLHSYKYEEEAFEQILKMFMSFVSIKMEHLFGVKPRLPECITLPVKEEESEK